MFESLSTRIQDVFKSLRGEVRLTPEHVETALREIRLALLEADVNFKVVKDFVAAVREKAIGQDILQSLTAGQAVVKIVHDELVELLGAGDHVFHLSGNPAVVAMVGLQGSGKTTSAAKLARHVIKNGRRPLLVAADPYRPAAVDQLETLGRQLDIPVYRAPGGTSVPDIARHGVDHEQGLDRLDRRVDGGDLLHERCVDAEPPGRVEDHDVADLAPCRIDALAGDVGD